MFNLFGGTFGECLEEKIRSLTQRKKTFTKPVVSRQQSQSQRCFPLNRVEAGEVNISETFADLHVCPCVHALTSADLLVVGAAVTGGEAVLGAMAPALRHPPLPTAQPGALPLLSCRDTTSC